MDKREYFIIEADLYTDGVWCTDEVPVSYICAKFYNLDKMFPF